MLGHGNARNISHKCDSKDENKLKIILHPVPAKKEGPSNHSGCLDSLVFRSPSPALMVKAAYYRRSAPSPTLKSPRGRMLTRKRQKKDFLQEDTEETRVPVSVGPGRPVSTCTVLTEDAYTYDLEVDLEDSEDDVDEVFKDNVPHDIQLNKMTYRTACRKLGLVPVAVFLRNVGEETMTLAHMSLTAAGVKACAIALVNNTRVKRLDLTGNDMGLEGAKYVAELVKESDYLTELILAENNFCNEGCRLITDEMQHNDRIQVLDLSGNNLTERGATYIAEMLDENRTLKELILSHNQFREKGGEILEPALVSNDALEVLDLSWNHLRQKGAVAIANGLALNTGLKVLRLGWNGFYEGGCKVLAAALEVNTCLQELDLSANRINLACLQRLGRGLLENRSLQILRIGENPLSTKGAILLLQLIRESPELPLNFLDITGQCVDDPFIQLLIEIQEQRDLEVKHGTILRQFASTGNGGEPIVREDPMMVLMEYMRIMNLRLVDLFTSLDKDGSKTLTRDEFKNGLLSANIPLEEKALDKLITKLDRDGDGEVDFGELIEGQKKHKKKLHRMKQRQKDMPFEETEIGRIHLRLRELMAIREEEQRQRLKQMRAFSISIGSLALPRRNSGSGPSSGVNSRRNSLLSSYQDLEFVPSRPDSGRQGSVISTRRDSIQPRRSLIHSLRRGSIQSSRPGSSATRPGSGTSRPGSGNSRPGSGNSRPGSGNSRAGSEDSRPGSGHSSMVKFDISRSASPNPIAGSGQILNRRESDQIGVKRTSHHHI